MLKSKYQRQLFLLYLIQLHNFYKPWSDKCVSLFPFCGYVYCFCTHVLENTFPKFILYFVHWQKRSNDQFVKRHFLKLWSASVEQFLISKLVFSKNFDEHIIATSQRLKFQMHESARILNSWYNLIDWLQNSSYS